MVFTLLQYPRDKDSTRKSISAVKGGFLFCFKDYKRSLPHQCALTGMRARTFTQQFCCPPVKVLLLLCLLQCVS